MIPKEIVVVGAGGVASYLLPVLVRTARDSNILLIDGDTLEERNLDRQLFDAEQVGQNKAGALASLYPATRFRSEFFHTGLPDLPEGAFYFGCADNHAARRAVLARVDQEKSAGVITGNEYTDSDAMFYHSQWAGTPLDPRVRHPELLTDNTGDPLRPAGCTGEAQAAAPQLAMANMLAAAYAMHFAWFYWMEMPELDRDLTRPAWPIRHWSNFNAIHTEAIKDHDHTRNNSNA